EGRVMQRRIAFRHLLVATASLLFARALSAAQQADPSFPQATRGPDRIEENKVLGKSLAGWIAELRHPEAAVRRQAVIALGKAGTPAVSAIPKLLRALKDPDAQVREAAAAALGAIGPSAWDDKAVPALIARYRDDSAAEVRKAALGSLINLVRPADRDAVSALRASLVDGG